MRRHAVALLVIASMLAVGCQAKDAEPAYVDGVLSAEILTEASWEWSPDADCATCHALEAETAEMFSCEAIRSEEGACAACHSDVSALEGAHALPFDTPSATRLRSTEVDSSSCSECHVADELTQATARDGNLADAEGNQANPHALPANETHDEIECLDCHQIHQSDIVESAQTLCSSCHHAGFHACYTCHS